MAEAIIVYQIRIVMAKKNPEETNLPKERAFSVGVEIFGNENLLSLDDSLLELKLLAETAGLDLVGQTTQKIDRPNPQTYIGSGKVEEIKFFIEELDVQVLLFDDELSPRHLRELEEIMGNKVRILDRTALILDIFAQHAHTREGALQVELATYEYRLPRLTRAWTHLARQTGGGGGRTGSTGGVGLRGPGETQLEVDRRDIRRRINHIKDELEKVRVHRSQHRARRKQSRTPVVSLVGYTNAGKSTLLNRLSDANVYVADQLFATLDPTTRRVELPGGHAALFTDTVGFIQKLPTTLIAAFRATLEEIADADLLLHVVDITHPNVQAQAKSVILTLDEIGAAHIPMITVVNKVDMLAEQERAKHMLSSFPNTVAISALKGVGISELLGKVKDILFEEFLPIKVLLPYSEGNLISLFHDSGEIQHTETLRKGVLIEGKLPGRLVARFLPFKYSELDVITEKLE
jgi:GTP-binding protein HflX